jgi:hypothetical protein
LIFCWVVEALSSIALTTGSNGMAV